MPGLAAVLLAAAAVADFIILISFAAEELQEVIHCCACDIVQGFLRQESLMGGDDDVGHGNEADQLIILHHVAGEVLVEEVALFLVDIQTGGAHDADLNAVDQGFGIDQTATGGVDDDHTGLHHFHGIVADHMVGLLGQGAVEGDDIGFAENLIQLHIVQSRIGIGEFVVGQNIHTEALADISKDPADLAGANDAYRFAVKVKAGKACQAEIEFPGAVIGLVDLPVDGQEHGHGMFRHGVGGVGRDTVDVDLAEAGLGIHIVEAGAAQGNDLYAHFIELVDHGFVNNVIDEYADTVKAGGQGNGILVQVGFKILDLQTGVFRIVVKTGHIIGLGVKKCDLHSISPLRFI